MKKRFRKSTAVLLVVVMIVMMITVGVVTVNALAFTPRYSAPTSSDSYYYSLNPFYKSGYGMPNCTCYAYGRAYELLGTEPSLSRRNAGQWYWYNKNNSIYSYGSTPKLGAIACWDKYDQNQGHVAVVETINGDSVTISESHYGGTYFDTRTIKSDSSNYLTSMRFLGYIYIGNFEDKPYARPSIVRTYINYQQSGTYRVNVEVTNVESISSVQVATWTQQDQSDLHWNSCAFNGGSTYFVDLSRSDFASNQTSYCNDVYVYDTRGECVGYERIGTIYNDPAIVKTYINYQQANSYRVNIVVTNVESISSVKVATWTQQDQSDLHWNSCAFNGGATYFVDLSRSDFASNQNSYCNDIYVYDGSGNCVDYDRIGTIYTKPKIDDIKVTKLSTDGYRVVCKLDSQFGIASAQLPTWTNKNGQDDLVWHSAVVSGDYISCYIKASDHNNEVKDYISHLYVTDNIGQYVGFTGILPYINLTNKCNEISVTYYKNNKYVLYNRDFTWEEANEWCESQGGHLVTLQDDYEWYAVKNMLEKTAEFLFGLVLKTLAEHGHG